MDMHVHMGMVHRARGRVDRLTNGMGPAGSCAIDLRGTSVYTENRGKSGTGSGKAYRSVWDCTPTLQLAAFLKPKRWSQYQYVTCMIDAHQSDIDEGALSRSGTIEDLNSCDPVCVPATRREVLTNMTY
jgi:hypothetical protein